MPNPFPQSTQVGFVVVAEDVVAEAVSLRVEEASAVTSVIAEVAALTLVEALALVSAIAEEAALVLVEVVALVAVEVVSIAVAPALVSVTMGFED